MLQGLLWDAVQKAKDLPLLVEAIGRATETIEAENADLRALLDRIVGMMCVLAVEDIADPEGRLYYQWPARADEAAYKPGREADARAWQHDAAHLCWLVSWRHRASASKLKLLTLLAWNSGIRTISPETDDATGITADDAYAALCNELGFSTQATPLPQNSH